MAFVHQPLSHPAPLLSERGGRTALGAALEATGDLPGARESLRAAFEGNLKHRGATHAHTREAGVIYARVLIALGEEAEAARVRRAAGIR